MARAFYRSYPGNGRRAGQVTRLHILREDGPYAGEQGWCSASARGVTRSDPIVLDPMPEKPPEGLRWCPPCVGRLAEAMGALDLFAAELAGIRP